MLSVIISFLFITNANYVPDFCLYLCVTCGHESRRIVSLYYLCTQRTHQSQLMKAFKGIAPISARLQNMIKYDTYSITKQVSPIVITAVTVNEGNIFVKKCPSGALSSPFPYQLDFSTRLEAQYLNFRF